MTWQTIESAPKDGTEILAWDGYDMTTVSWFQATPKYGAWHLVAAGAYAEDCDWEPTHWMPLPEEPK